MAWLCDVCGRVICEHEQPHMAVRAHLCKIRFTDDSNALMLLCPDCTEFIVRSWEDVEDILPVTDEEFEDFVHD